MIRLLALAMVMAVALVGCKSDSAPGVDPYSSGTNTGLEPFDDSTGFENFPLTEPMGLVLSPTLRFSDVPVPMGAKEDRERSYVYQSPSLQLGRMVYNAKASINEIAQFYLEHCPRMGWNLENVVEANGAYILFEKVDKRLVVTIHKEKLKRGAQFVLQLSPKE